MQHEERQQRDEHAQDIRLLPAQAERVETGPVQFGDDWPGVFIRGDNAFAFCMALRSYMRDRSDPFAAMTVKDLLETLASSDLTGLSTEREPRR